MIQILRWLATRAGKMELFCPLGTTRRVPQEKFSRKPYYVWVIDQVWGQDGWILAKFFSWVFMDRDEVEVHKLAKKERGQYPTILTEQTWSIKDLLYLSGKFFMRDTAGSPERARWFHLARSGSQSQHAIWFTLPARRARHIIKILHWPSLFGPAGCTLASLFLCEN